MTEQILRDYFEGDVSFEVLNKGLEKDNSNNFKIQSVNEKIKFNVTIDHLIKLCNDVISDKISLKYLSSISFCLESSDYFVWDSKTKEGERIASVLNIWTSPEINSPLTKEYLNYCAYYLETGEPR